MTFNWEGDNQLSLTQAEALNLPSYLRWYIASGNFSTVLKPKNDLFPL